MKLFTFLFILPLCLMSQSNTLSSGKSTSNSSGSVSYTIGQANYSYSSNSNYQITEGVQQPYEISVLESEDIISNKVNIFIYPNPTSKYVYINTQEIDDKFQYGLYSITGKLIDEKLIENKSHRLSLDELPNGVYILKILKDNTLIKSSKLIKK